MASIGYVTPTGTSGYRGILKTLTVTTEIVFQKVGDTQPDAKQPAYRIYSGNGAEIGAAWIKTGKDSGQPYVSVKLDAPEFQKPLYATLGKNPEVDEDVYSLIWNRND